MHPFIISIVIVASAAIAKKVVDELFRPSKVFISYYYDKDSSLKRLLKAWSHNRKFDIQFEDVSADVFLDTKTDQELANQLTKRIEKADVVLVLIGDFTHSRKWVRYEIKEAVRLSKPIVVVKQKRSHISPPELKGVGAHWVYGFKAQKVNKALKECI